MHLNWNKVRVIRCHLFAFYFKECFIFISPRVQALAFVSWAYQGNLVVSGVSVVYLANDVAGQQWCQKQRAERGCQPRLQTSQGATRALKDVRSLLCKATHTVNKSIVRVAVCEGHYEVTHNVVLQGSDQLSEDMVQRSPGGTICRLQMWGFLIFQLKTHADYLLIYFQNVWSGCFNMITSFSAKMEKPVSFSWT